MAKFHVIFCAVLGLAVGSLLYETNILRDKINNLSSNFHDFDLKFQMYDVTNQWVEHDLNEYENVLEENVGKWNETFAMMKNVLDTRELTATCGQYLVLNDYLELFNGNRECLSKSSNDWQELARVMRHTKLLTNDLKSRTAVLNSTAIRCPFFAKQANIINCWEAVDTKLENVQKEYLQFKLLSSENLEKFKAFRSNVRQFCSYQDFKFTRGTQETVTVNDHLLSIEDETKSLEFCLRNGTREFDDEDSKRHSKWVEYQRNVNLIHSFVSLFKLR